MKSKFEMSDLHAEQRDAIKLFFQGKNVPENLPTGFGKSFQIFQCLPIVANNKNNEPCGSSVIVDISPLQSLTEDQVWYSTDLCIAAISITNEEDPEVIQQVLNGNYI